MNYVYKVLYNKFSFHLDRTKTWPPQAKLDISLVFHSAKKYIPARMRLSNCLHKNQMLTPIANIAATGKA
jgi:hypothetical protein